MSTASTTSTPTATCPTWCRGRHFVDRDDRTHVADQGVWHHSDVIDSWLPDHGDASEPIVVNVEGYRRDHPKHPEAGPDWTEVRADGDVCPGFMGGVSLPVADARRLGLALIAAADL